MALGLEKDAVKGSQGLCNPPAVRPEKGVDVSGQFSVMRAQPGQLVVGPLEPSLGLRQSCAKLVDGPLKRVAFRHQGLHAGMLDLQRTANRIRVVQSQVTGPSSEGRGSVDLVILHVPAASALLLNEAGLPLLEHLPLSMALAADGVVTSEETDGKDAPAVKAGIVSPARRQVYGRRLLPALHLNAVEPRSQIPVPERTPNIPLGIDVGICRPEVQDRKVDGVVPQPVDELDTVP